ncbi:MAG TPA: TerC/Alx family metal homeostasis membrane protein [Propionicimonas sp.]|nr:TerC/Alx family metal homeostasis membrane protein [Propionicimonas sp.]HQA77996.1 TerC/Alx family metal homeostasis membrane protein [Propionicimonas sp.]HQD97272.1 TerC/Alx family metal homeostasis membrane protein [Propionicimonas sp.]
MTLPVLEIAIGSPEIWWITIAAVLALFVLDFVITRRPHEVSMKEAVGWSAFYIALPLAFGVWIWTTFGSERGLEFYAGYLVEKSLSVDNLFVFMLLLSSFAVPRELQQRVLLIGVAGALVLRGVFIALGAAMLANFAWTFLLFGAILLATAVKVLRDTMNPAEEEVNPGELRIVRLVRRFWPVTDGYRGPRMIVVEDGKRALTPLALATLAILATDVVFAVDSVPAVFGITGDAYLVFVTNAFALLGLRALYFVLEGALGALVHLGYGLAAILAFIGAKLVMHWAHGIWSWVPEVDTLFSLGVIVGILAIVITTSLIANKRQARAIQH